LPAPNDTSGRPRPDLLWALRGGGGNFGVVTSLEYRLHEIGPEVFFLMTIYPGDATRDGLRVFGEVMTDAPEELMALGILWTAGHEEPVPEAWQGQPVFVVVGVWSGSLEQGEEATRALREIAEPIVDLSGPTPFEAAQQAFDPEYPDGRRYYWKSIYLPELDDAAIETLVASAAARPSPLSSVDVWALGGAMSREPAGAARSRVAAIRSCSASRQIGTSRTRTRPTSAGRGRSSTRSRPVHPARPTSTSAASPKRERPCSRRPTGRVTRGCRS
jgi:hypothetical protein